MPLHSSDMIITQYLLLSADSINNIRTVEALKFLSSSSRSRFNNRHLQLPQSLRERMTSFIGILFLSGIPFSIDAYPVAGGIWILTIFIYDGTDAGAPSAATAPLSPKTPSRRASGIYKDWGPYVYKKHTQSFYLSKTGPGEAPSDLPCRGLKWPRA